MSNYNIFSMLPNIPHNIIDYLIDNNDFIFRLLAYNNASAWQENNLHPNLTKQEKAMLIYDGAKIPNDCRIFFDTGLDDSWQDEVSILRISVLEAIPTNYIYGYLTIAAEIYVHSKINTLSSYQPRDLAIAQSLIQTLNGAEIGGLGRLFFDYQRNSRSKMITIGNQPFKGKVITFCNWAV